MAIKGRMLDLCDQCEIREAQIFQDEGKFCPECWQQRTEPHSGHK